MSRGFFITGTDTGVGKTFIGATLLAAFRAAGLDVGAWKPVQSGCEPDAPDADGSLLKLAGNLPEPAGVIASYSFAAPLAPFLAARLAGVSLTLDEVLARGQPLRQRYPYLLVEGAGGLLVPMGADWLVADLAARLGLPLLIVARPGLGTVNHTLLTIAAARQRGLVVAGVILNGYRGEPPDVPALDALPAVAATSSEPTNPLLIRFYGRVPVLGRVPLMTAGDWPTRLAAAASYLDLAALRRLLEAGRA